MSNEYKTDAGETKEELFQRISELQLELASLKENYAEIDLSVDLKSAQIFKEKYEEIRHKNGSFSIRSLAKKVGISSGKISDIFNGRYVLSRELAQRITKNLDFGESLKAEFLRAVEKENTRIEAYRAFVKTHLSREKFFANEISHNEDIGLVDHWICYALLASLELNDCDRTISWISRRLKMDEDMIQKNMDKIVNAGFVEKKEGLYYLVSLSNLNNSLMPTSPEASKQAARHCASSVYHYLADRIDKALINKELATSENRNFFYIGAIDSNKIGNVPEFLSHTIHNAINDLGASENRDEIYMMHLTCTRI